MIKFKLSSPLEISEIVKEKQLTNIIIETGNENIYLPNEHKFIVTKNFLLQTKNVFYSCETLEKIDMSNFDFGKITTMSWWFYGCKNLKEIIFPEQANLKYLESLCGCFAKTAISFIDLSFIQAKYRPIDFECTFHNSKVEKIILPRCTIHNMKECFSICANLKEVIAPVSFKYFNEYILFDRTFYNCPNLKKIDFTNSRIASSVFCDKLTDDFNENNLPEDCIIVLP